MVASDTIVGLVGAGILLVALVGVFLYESGEIGSEFDVEASMPASIYEGSARLTQTTGAVNGPTGPICQAPACSAARTDVYVNVTGLPVMTDLSYVVFLTGGSPVNLGALQVQGSKYTLTYQRQEDRSSATAIVISVEKAATATSPGLIVYSKPVQSGTTNLNGGTVASLATGTHALHLDDSTGNTVATITYEGLTQHAGLQYRAWLKRADGTYDHLANYTADAAGEITGGASGQANEYAQFVVTLENESSRVDKPHGFGPLFSATLTSA